MRLKMRHFFIVSIYFSMSFIGVSHATSLHQAVQLTLNTNPEYLVKNAQENQAYQRVWESAGEFFPSVDFSATDGPERSLNFSTNLQWVKLHRSDTDIRVKENLFNGLKSTYSVKENNARLKSARYSVRNTKQDLALSAVEVYLNILQNQALVDTAKKNVAVHVATFSIIGKRAKGGVSSISERELTAGRVAVSRARYYDAIKEEKDSIASYIKVIGIVPRNLKMPTSYIANSNVSLRQAVMLAIHNNPVLKKAKSDIKAELYAYRGNHSTFLPNVDLELTRFRGENIAGIESAQYNSSVLMRLSWNLFRGGSDYALLKRSAYKKVETQDEARRQEREIVEGTVQAYNRLQNLIKALPQYKIHMMKSKLVVKAYRKQYVAGKRTLLDVLNSENELYDATRRYIIGQYDIIISRYILLNFMGIILQAI